MSTRHVITGQQSIRPERPLTLDAIADAARAYSPDPLPDLVDHSVGGAVWLYRRTDFELAKLHHLVARGFAANRFVHYAANYGRPASTVEFQTALLLGAHEVTVRCNGALEVWIDDNLIQSFPAGAEPSVLDLSGGTLTLRVSASVGQPAALSVHGLSGSEGQDWRARKNRTSSWEPVLPRAGGETPPHLDELPTTALTPRRAGEVFALDAPVLGHVRISSAERPEISSGESVAEAQAPSEVLESRHDLVPAGDRQWSTRHQLGVRFVGVRSADSISVEVDAVTAPVRTRGAFVCSDERLNRIWGTSAYTLRLCVVGLMVDGIKRDRMPWAGDHALSTLANAYAFANDEVARDSIVALGSPTHGYVNGIADYSLWWVINTGYYVRYFGDLEHVRREASHLDGFLTALAVYADDAGFYRPVQQEDGFADASHGSVFLDWGVEVQAEGILVPLQILWYWALRTAAELLERAQHPGADRWRSLSERLRASLRGRGWSEEAGAWREYLDGAVTDAPHAHALGILSGLTDPLHHETAAQVLLRTPRTGTPFMTSFVLRALIAAGHETDAVSRLAAAWGGMLDAGARTFWEEFPESGEADTEMYGRPFGKSLCHAWSAGPAAMLPEAVLGLRPLDDGWREFTVKPQLGDLEWAAASVPTPHGFILVEADQHIVRVTVPVGAVADLAGEKVHGPITVEVPAPPTASTINDQQGTIPLTV